MPVFVYKAKDSEGKTTKSIIEAPSYQEALSKLREEFSAVLLLKETKRKFAKRIKKVSLDSLAQFSRELATMVGAGTPLVKSLTILGNQFKEKTLSEIAHDLAKYIEAGNSFADGLKKYPKVFSPLYINTVVAGETSGTLKDVLERLANYLENTSILLRKIKTAMIYPTAVVIVAIIITSFLVFKIIPGFKEIFENLGGELPLPTRIVIKVSDTFKKYFFFIAGFFIISFLIFIRLINTSRGRFLFDKFKLKIPVLGPLFQKVAISRFSRTLGILLRSGVPILEALKIVSKAVGNKVLEESILKTLEEVRRGKTLAPNLEKSKIFPPMVIEMISVGEESGELENMLENIADSYDTQVDIATNNLVSLIEPFIIIFLGVVIGGIVVSMFLPILKITQLLGR